MAPVRLGVVIPLANEGANVDDLLRRVAAQVGEGDRVFCVLDRVSRDDTRARVEEFGARDGRFEVVWAPENRSVVDAYFRGYREALDAECAWILEMDGGLSHLPEQIPQFVAAMEAGFDFAGGSRFAPGGRHAGSAARRAISWGGTVLANRMLGTRMSDMTSGFECFRRDALEHVIARGVRSRAHFFQTEIRWMMHRFRWTEIPIDYTCASPSVGTSSLTDALVSLRELRRRARAERAP
ncbi:MAG: glycosyltransferase family 2 protein [Deltaproteobacteria bacterium]